MIWALMDDPNLSTEARGVISDPNSNLFVSVAAFWEVAVKRAKKGGDRSGFKASARDVRDKSIDAGYRVLAIDALHAAMVEHLPFHGGHKDPFDRLMVAQAQLEGLVLLTVDHALPSYGPHVRLV